MVSSTVPASSNEDYYPSSHLTDHEHTPTHSDDSAPSPVPMDTTTDKPEQVESGSSSGNGAHATDEFVEVSSKTRTASSLSSVYTQEPLY